jgi:hypothetical protein
MLTKQASVHARMVMKMVLIEVKTAIGPSQAGRTSTCWSDGQGRAGHTSTSWRGIARLQVGLAVYLGLTTAGCRFAWFAPQNSGGGSQGGTWHHMRVCVEAKQLREGLVAANAWNPFLTIFPSWLSGSRQIPRGSRLRMCNSPINKDSSCPKQPSFPPKVISLG